MEVYILDALLRRVEVVDRFISLIWTEREREVGDFELHLASTPANRNRFPTGKQLVVNESVRLMTVETVEDTTDSEGRKLLKVTGKSLENILDDRTAMKTTDFTIGNNKWKITGNAKTIIETMFNSICVTGTLSAQDVIPFLGSGAIFPTDSIAADPTSFDWYQEPDTLLNAIKNLCDIFDMGFRLVRNPVTNLLRFDVFTGSDRTTLQTARPAIIFSPEMGNLQNTTEYATIAGTKNCAYVWTEVGGSYYWQLVYPDDVDPDVEGFERRALTLNITLDDSEITTIPASINTALQAHGKEELAKLRPWSAFDGEVSQYSQFKYGVDYHIGDLVSMRNSDGNLNSMKVTEQIFVSDEQGDRSYPTLSIRQFVEPGSWISMGSIAWEDMGLTDYWETMP
jgi:hypothetical protein